MPAFRPSNDGIYYELLCIKELIMSKLDELKADFADFKAQAFKAVDDLQASVEALKGQVGGVTDSDLQSVIDSIDQAKAALAVDVAPAPVPTPEPAPPVEAPVEAPAPVDAPVEVTAEEAPAS